MCGIAGWYRRRSRAVPRDIVEAQCNAIWHRGPDDGGIVIDGDFGFGARRLSIIDIAGGHQPIRTDDERFSITFNGEVVNHLSLRGELLELGHTFHTQSDTETILLAYREWGDAAWARLDGMFAVAIWDHRERVLTLARDPLGIKPLYVTEQNGGLAFGSEIKSLLPVPKHAFSISPRAVHDFFSFGHIRTNRSIYEQVRTVPPGHVLLIGPNGSSREHAFWTAKYRSLPQRSDSQWIDEFRERWLQTVKDHLLADVEVGAFLSGGIDSSAVVAAMAKLTDQPVRTFTIGFPVERYNEAPVAEAVARHFGCDHTTFTVDLARARDILPEVQRCYDEPFADPAAVPTWYLSRLARQHVKVVLSGDGGDELFMGYKRHLTERRIAQLSPFVRRTMQAAAWLPPTPVAGWNHAIQRWQRTAESASEPDGISRFFGKTQITSRALRKRVLNPDIEAKFDSHEAYRLLRDEYFPNPAKTISADDLEQFAYADLTLNLPCAMLTKVDRASMANSLEVRVPFLSRTLVDWAMGVPTSMKVRNGVGKYILRKAIAPWVLPEVATRGKQAFQMPLSEWFSEDFGRFAQELWQDSGVADLDFLSPPAVDALFDEHRKGRRDHSRFLYALSMFSLWWLERRSMGSAGRRRSEPAAA